MKIDKKIIGAFILGIIVTAIVVHSYTVYQVRQLALNNQAAVVEIVNFINASLEAQGTDMPGTNVGGMEDLPIGQ